MIEDSFEQALKSADCIYSRRDIEDAIARMAREIARDFAQTPPLVLAVMNGGLYTTAFLTVQLPLDCRLDYVHASRYRGETAGSELQWLKKPGSSLRGERILLVDDILDEGHTLAAIKEYCLREGAISVGIAVLCVKKHARAIADVRADYCGLEVPDRYVFGFGMDYHEHGRHYPGIYAVGQAAS